MWDVGWWMLDVRLRMSDFGLWMLDVGCWISDYACLNALAGRD